MSRTQLKGLGMHARWVQQTKPTCGSEGGLVTPLGTWAIASVTTFGVGATQTTLGQEGHSQCHLQLGRQGKREDEQG